MAILNDFRLRMGGDEYLPIMVGGMGVEVSVVAGFGVADGSGWLISAVGAKVGSSLISEFSGDS